MDEGIEDILDNNEKEDLDEGIEIIDKKRPKKNFKKKYNKNRPKNNYNDVE